MVQRAGFEPAKHYALGPHPSPFDRSGTSALQSTKSLTYITMVKRRASDYQTSKPYFWARGTSSPVFA